MGRQIRFLQSKLDVMNFVDFLKTCDALMVIYYQECYVMTNVEQLFYLMDNCCGNVSIIPSSYLRNKSCIEKKYAEYWNGTSISYGLCMNIANDARYFNTGRIYLAVNYIHNQYDPDLAALYKQIVVYIKKNYRYLKDYRCYLGEDYYTHYFPNDTLS